MLCRRNYTMFVNYFANNMKNDCRPKIIAITGAKRSGKDTLANYIAYRYLYEKIHIADPLKDAVSALFSFSKEQVGDNDAKDQIDNRWGITPRKALQFFGTEVIQYKMQELLPGIDRKFLAYSLVNKIEKDGYYVVSDLRFYHEYEELAKLDAFIIRVDRPVSTEDQNQDVLVHPSEVEYRMIPCHMNIMNDKDISHLIRNFETNWSKYIQT